MAKEDKDKFYKKNLSHLTVKEIGSISEFLEKSGYKNNSDYRINYFNHDAELIIVNKKLEKSFKSLLKINDND